MLKEIATYAFVTASVVGVLGAGPAQANDQPSPSPNRQATTPQDPQSTPTSQGDYLPRPRHYNNIWWVKKDKEQKNESNNVIYLCDVHILSLDHILVGKSEENGKCAQSSYNSN